MVDYEKAAEDLYFIKQATRPGWFFGVSIILGTTDVGLVDTGFENTPEDHIFPLLYELGRNPKMITQIVNTHRDGDHVRGNSMVKAVTGAPIAIHELDADSITTADIRLRHNDQVRLGDRTFRVLHTPGHRPGSICLYDADQQTLISGDSVCGDRRDLIRMDKHLYIRSLQQLLTLDLRMLIMSHPFQPLGKSILIGDEPKTMIRASIAIAENL
jgi:glyoxylase-like metal-dependent hydrolase (beta-lactamase superfamily II)